MGHFDTADGTSVAGTEYRAKDRAGAFQLGALAVGGIARGGGGAGPGSGFANAAGEAAQTAVGMRSIRIDIPRSGQAFTFTKVLNLKSEPLGIELALMPLGKFRAAQSAGQLALFIGGLLWAFICWRSAERSSFGIALGVALALAGVIWLGLSARTLHWVMIGAVPVLGGPLLCWLAWRMWPKREVMSEKCLVISEDKVASAAPVEPKPAATDSGSGPVPPAAALLLFAFLTASSLTLMPFGISRVSP